MKFVIPTLALALTVVDAFRVDVSDVAPPADILGEHQELERTFKVYSEDALEKISIGIAGPVFVAYKDANAEVPATSEPTTPEPTTETPSVTPKPTTPEPTTPEVTTPEPTSVIPTVTPDDVDDSEDGSIEGSSAGSNATSDDTIVFPEGTIALHAASHKEKLVATVTITGNSADLLNLIDLVPYKKEETDGFRLSYKNKDASVEGYVLTQIHVAEKQTVRHIATEVASVVNVDSDVVTHETKKSIKVWSAGATNVFVTEEGNLTAKNVALDVTGSGSIQFVAGSLKLDNDLSTTLAGSGSLAVHATNLKTSVIKTDVSGSGSLFVMTNTVEVKELSSAVYGSAFASYVSTTPGHVENEKLTIAGSGVAYAGSIIATKSKVDIWGSGQAYVQVTDKLKTSASYSGQVYYVGAKPAEVKTSGWFFWRSQVKPAESDKSIAHVIVTSPPVYPTHVALELKENHHEKEPRIKLVDTSGVSVALLTTHLTAVAHGPNGVLIFASVAVGLVAVAMVAHSYQQHRVRRHYTPLV